jgi:hypothetical protein
MTPLARALVLSALLLAACGQKSPLHHPSNGAGGAAGAAAAAGGASGSPVSSSVAGADGALAGVGGALADAGGTVDASAGGALDGPARSDGSVVREGGVRPEAGSGPYRAVAVVTGLQHTCALLDDGNVKCWGLNLVGQLGYGDTYRRGGDAMDMGDALPLVDLGTGRFATAIAAGGDATCALLDDGTVKCWGGADLNGQPGDGTQNRGDQPGEMGDALPALELGPRRATEVAVGDAIACALLDDGTVSCWGKGASAAGTPAPVSLVSSLNPTTAPVRTLSGVDKDMLALFADGSITRLFEQAFVPFLAPNVQATAVHGSYSDQCALVNGGVISCKNHSTVFYDMSIDGTESFFHEGTFQVAPDPLPRLIGFGMLGYNGGGLCAIREDGTVECQPVFYTNGGACRPDWCVPSTNIDDNSIYIQLGQKAVDLTSGGGGHMCALLANGEVRCWGSSGATNDALGSSFDLIETNGTNSYGPFHSINLGNHR